MFAPEAPEVLFEDYGVGQLINGEAITSIDPIFSNNSHVDSNHPLKVFIQLEGDCNGVYVTNKSTIVLLFVNYKMEVQMSPFHGILLLIEKMKAVIPQKILLYIAICAFQMHQT
jgi:hypothetical protein